MSYAHRDGDIRACGANTTVIGQDFVRINGKLWAVNGDTETHGDGQLITTNSWIKISGIGVIVVGDNANADDLCGIDGGNHCDPVAIGSASFVNVL